MSKRTREGRLHLRLPSDLLQQMRQYAERREVTLTLLIESYFREVLEAERQAKVFDAEQV